MENMATEKTRFLFLVIFISFATFSCSTIDLIYWGGEKVIKYEIGRNLKLSGEQKKEVDRELKELLEWHKLNRLPAYEALLEEINANFAAYPLDKALIERNINLVTDSLEKEQVIIANKVIPPATEFLLSLNKKQIDNFAAKIIDESEREEYYNTSKEEYDELRMKRVVRTAGFFGIKFNAQQKNAIRNESSTLLDNREYFQGFYVKQREALLLAMRNQDRAELPKILEKLMIYDVGNFPPEYASSYYLQQERAKALMAEIFTILNEKQVISLRKRINRFITRIRNYSDKIRARQIKNE